MTRGGGLGNESRGEEPPPTEVEVITGAHTYNHGQITMDCNWKTFCPSNALSRAFRQSMLFCPWLRVDPTAKGLAISALWEKSDNLGWFRSTTKTIKLSRKLIPIGPSPKPQDLLLFGNCLFSILYVYCPSFLRQVFEWAANLGPSPCFSSSSHFLNYLYSLWRSKKIRAQRK